MMPKLMNTFFRLACVSWLLCTSLNGQPPPQPTITPNTQQQGVNEGGEELRSQIKTHPGIVAWRDGKWLWSDHLFNLTNNINVEVEYASPDSMKSMVDTAKLEGEVQGLFKAAGITPYARPEPGKPDLPNFHLLIIAHPVKDGYSFMIVARLLEAVELDRVKLDDRVTMQAITWEQASIHVVQRADFDKDLDAAVKEVVKHFTDRFQFFERLRQQGK